MLFSFILATYNRIERLKRTLDSLDRALAGSKDWELIVVDNNSPDGTGVYCADRYASNQRVTVMNNAKRQSAYASRNMGIRRAAGEYLLFLEDDLIIPRDWVDKVRERIVSELKGWRVISQTIRSRGWYSNVLTTIQEVEKRRLLESGVTTGCISTASLIVKRDVFRDLGLFCEDGRGGDIEFTTRLRGSGEDVALLLDVWVYHEFVFTLRDFVTRSFAYGFSFSANAAQAPGLGQSASIPHKLCKNLRMPFVWARQSDVPALVSLPLCFAHELAFVLGGLAQRKCFKQNPVA